MPVTDVRTDPVAITLTVESEWDATVDQVWELWSDPRKLERWWGPPEWPATVTEHDLRPGGRVAYFMRGPDGEQSGGYWDVLAVDAPHRLEVRDGFATPDGAPNNEMPTMTMVTTITAINDGRTHMQTVTTFGSVEILEQLVDMGMVDGMRAAMSQIEGVLAS